MRMAMKLEEAARLARVRRLTEERAREIISDMVADVHGGEGLRSFTTRKWFEHFAKIKADSRDPRTAAKYEQVKTEFLSFLRHKADENILSVSSADVRGFRDHRKASGVTATTLNDALTILSAYFNAAWRDHVISNNPCTAVETAKDDLTPAKRQKQPFTIAQIKSILEAAKGDWPGLIRVAFFTGARLHNCVTLRFRNLDFAADPPVLIFEKYSKHGDEHRVPMHPALKDHLLSIVNRRDEIRATGKIITLPQKESDAFLFPSLAECRVANLSKQFGKIMAAAGIENLKLRQGVTGKGRGAARDVWALGFHSLRRSNVSCLANAGVSEERRMRLAAHSTRDVHQGYTHHELTQLSKDVARLPPI